MKAYKSELLGLLTALGLLSMLAITASAYAEDGRKAAHGPGLHGPAMMSERMAERLGLDESQEQQVRDIIESAKPEFEALRARVLNDINAVLTPEQQEQFAEAQERMRSKMTRRAREHAPRSAE